MKPLRRHYARTLDFAMCALMNGMQRRHWLDTGSRSALEAYMDECEGLTPAQYFAVAPVEPGEETERGSGLPILRWDTPRPSGYPANDRAHALLFMANRGAPTVLMLHALASLADRGYRALGRRFNAAGWNACFVHLPYHYSRVPPGCRNGELAITPDLVRTAEGLRQGVNELRQLMMWLRGQGVDEFGLWATSYGGWIGALLLGVESDFRFAVLQAPIVDISQVIWESPASRHLRAELTSRDITRALVERMEHLAFPMNVQPACGAERVILAAGVWDEVSRAEDIATLHRRWSGSTILTVEQGHFGYQMEEACFRHLQAHLLREIPAAPNDLRIGSEPDTTFLI